MRLASPFDLHRESAGSTEVIRTDSGWPKESTVAHDARIEANAALPDLLNKPRRRVLYDGTPRRAKRRNTGSVERRWYRDGTRRALFHKRGTERQGPGMGWHPSGQPAWEGEMLHGSPHRDFQSWWANGAARLSGTFDHGRPVGMFRLAGADGRGIFSGPWQPWLADWLPAGVRDGVND
jgi:hypothetical protein